MGLKRKTNCRSKSQRSPNFKVSIGRKEKAQIKSNVQMAASIRKKLAEAAVVGDDVASNIAVDFADITAVGERHKKLIGQLLRLRFPSDLEKLESLLVTAQVDLLWENNWHLKSLRHELPKILRSLDERLRGKKDTKKKT